MIDQASSTYAEWGPKNEGMKNLGDLWPQQGHETPHDWARLHSASTASCGGSTPTARYLSVL